MPDSSELDNIIHYQKSLVKYTESRNDTKILHCIFKLFNMHVTMSHLEKTGIGRTVNSLRKLGGEVGDAANTLVKKWKDMVSKKNDDEKSEANPNEPDSTQESQSYRYESNSSHKYSDKSKNSDRKEILNRDDKHRNRKKDEYVDKHKSNSEIKHKSDKRSSERRDRSSCDSDHVDSESGVSLDSDNSASDSEEVPSITHSKDNKYDKDKKYEHKHTEHKESASEKNSKHKRDSNRDRKHERSHSKETRKHDSDNDRKRKRHDSCSNESNEQVSKHSSNSISKSSSKRKQDDSSSDEEIKTKILKKSSSHRSSREGSHRDHKKENRSESDNEISSRDTHKSSSHKNKESSSSSSREYKKEIKSESDRKEHRSSSKNSSKSERKKEEYSRDESSKSSDKHRKETSTKKDKERKSDIKEKSKSKSNSKSNSTGSTSSSTSTSKKMVDIGSESGTSFAEALGMLEPTSSKKSSSSKKNKSSETNHKVYKTVPEKSVEEKSLPEKPSKSDKIDIMIPPPPKNDIDLNIASLLPPITPNYKPIGNPFFESCNTRNRIMNDDEALSLVMSQKNQRTKVYSGNKSFYGTVPTLFELCIRILQDNIDALEYTGGVPYVILKPVLDKATPDQLFMLEHHNPYLIEDTDEIWQFHCNKEFRNKKREELESWREMYMRCLDEREAKLKALTENIKLAQDKSIPVRQTKLAYVDSVVKPPRDVIRRQAKSGVDKKPIVTPSSRLNTLALSGGAGQVSVPSPVKASSSGGSSAAMKPKKAPLMQKTLAFLKGNRFRR